MEREHHLPDPADPPQDQPEADAEAPAPEEPEAANPEEK
jgi:hypothetical protein